MQLKITCTNLGRVTGGQRTLNGQLLDTDGKPIANSFVNISADKLLVPEFDTLETDTPYLLTIKPAPVDASGTAS